MHRVHVVPHFDNDSFADRMIFMNDNSKPLRARIVRAFRQKEANGIFHWPTISFDMNPIEHSMDFIGR